jgi:transposase
LPKVNKTKAKTGRKPLPEALEREVYQHELSALVVNVAKHPFMNAEKKSVKR